MMRRIRKKMVCKARRTDLGVRRREASDGRNVPHRARPVPQTRAQNVRRQPPRASAATCRGGSANPEQHAACGAERHAAPYQRHAACSTARLAARRPHGRHHTAAAQQAGRGSAAHPGRAAAPGGAIAGAPQSQQAATVAGPNRLLCLLGRTAARIVFLDSRAGMGELSGSACR
jgi:hypothetical protein